MGREAVTVTIPTTTIIRDIHYGLLSRTVRVEVVAGDVVRKTLLVGTW